MKHVSGGVELLKSELAKRADPASTHYLAWLSKTEVDQILRPDPNHLRHVENIVAQHGGLIESVVGANKLIVSFPGPALPDAFVTELMASQSVDAIAPRPFTFDVGGVRVRVGRAQKANASALPVTDQSDQQATCVDGDGGEVVASSSCCCCCRCDGGDEETRTWSPGCPAHRRRGRAAAAVQLRWQQLRRCEAPMAPV